MTETEALYRDTRRVMRRQARASALARFTPYTMPGGPRRSAPAVPALPVWKYLVGGGGQAVSLSLDGVVRVPGALRPVQQRAPRTAPERHSGCCHCAQAERREAARQRVWTGRGRSYGSVETVFDAHAHFFGASAADFLVSFFLFWFTPPTNTFTRIGWLTEDMAATGINHMVLSGFFDTTVDPTESGVAGDWVLGDDTHEAWEVDCSVSFASALHPDFFLPFTNGFRLSEDPVTQVEDQLATWSGWRGIGEIIVHGHGSHFSSASDTTNLQEILKVAATQDLPVQLHWDICDVNVKDYSPAQNYAQLLEVLDASPDTTVILAHCGVGEYDSETATVDVDNWKVYIGELIAAYPNLHFDLGGMQVVGTGVTSVRQLVNEDEKTLTDVGQFLLETMSTYPERFLLGTDVETRTYSEWEESASPDGNHHFGIEQYTASVSDYLAFLQMGVDQGLLDDSKVAMIRQTNGEDLFGV